MRVTVYEVDNGPCPYLPNRKWMTHSFAVSSMSEESYEQLLTSGWRRSGVNFYQNHCPGCSCCIPLRVPAAGFVPSKSQRRVMRRNADVTVELALPSRDPEVVELYKRYLESQHQQSESPGQFARFLVESPLDTRVMLYRVAERLVGAGWVDLLPGGLSSVYFAFDPAESRRSLGTYSLIREMELARSLGKPWLHMGFYVPGSPKMEYKGRFRPHEFAVDGQWTEDESKTSCP